MRIEALVIGDELLDGRVTDTNSVRLARALGDHGLVLSQRCTVVDDIDPSLGLPSNHFFSRFGCQPIQGRPVHRFPAGYGAQ